MGHAAGRRLQRVQRRVTGSDEHGGGLIELPDPIPGPPAAAAYEGVASRVTLLRQAAGFAALPPDVLAAVAASLVEERYAAGQVVVAEGDIGDRLFLIAAGRVEVSVAGPDGYVPVATMDAGEVFGEVALLAPAGRRLGTVTSLTRLACFSLSRQAFDALASAHAGLREGLAERARDVVEADFLKRVSPFAKLDPRRLRWLAGRLEREPAAAGANVVRQGETGDSCYLLFSGRAEVLVRDGGSDPKTGERRLATMGPGSLFGEAAVLTDAARNATVRMLEAGELLVLRRADLLAAIREAPGAGAAVLGLLGMRGRPEQADESVSAHVLTGVAGDRTTVLKNAARGAYYRLSEQGWFLWQRMDGRRTIRDLTLDLFAEHKQFAPHLVADLVQGLTAAGFVRHRGLRPDVLTAARAPAGVRALLAVGRALEWQVSIGHLDAPLGRAYRAGGWLLFTPPAQLLFGLVAAAGLAAFLVLVVRASSAAGGLAAPLWGVPIAALIALLIHEVGHALTAKAVGRQVHRAGFGWYRIGPVLFVDTSDMWLAPRRARIAVTAAGPYANIVTAGAAALAALAPIPPMATAALMQFAVVSYVIVLYNLNPLLEYDGYYMLMDYLDRPNLRAHLLGRLRAAIRSPARDRRTALSVLYAAVVLAYLAAAAAGGWLAYHLLAQRWVERSTSAAVAEALAWVVGGSVLLMAMLAAFLDVAGGPAKSRTISR